MTPSQEQCAVEILNGPNSQELIECIFRISIGESIDEQSNAGVLLAVEAGWIDARTKLLTPLGQVVADPLREYKFWLDRGKMLHGAAQYGELLDAPRYCGKELLEIGSGFGCNLFSLAGVKGKFVGVEPVEIYRQFTKILAAREGIQTPEVVKGWAEKLPFGDASFDIVLCYSSHQYTDIRVALEEMSRVTRPGGQIQIIGGTLGSYSLGCGRLLLARPRLGSLSDYMRTLVNTSTYTLFGRRISVPHGATATTAPIYPSVASMQRWMVRVGLKPREDLMRKIDGETCFVAERMNKGQ